MAQDSPNNLLAARRFIHRPCTVPMERRSSSSPAHAMINCTHSCRNKVNPTSGLKMERSAEFQEQQGATSVGYLPGAEIPHSSAPCKVAARHISQTILNESISPRTTVSYHYASTASIVRPISALPVPDRGRILLVRMTSCCRRTLV